MTITYHILAKVEYPYPGCTLPDLNRGVVLEDSHVRHDSMRCDLDGAAWRGNVDSGSPHTVVVVGVVPSGLLQVGVVRLSVVDIIHNNRANVLRPCCV